MGAGEHSPCPTRAVRAPVPARATRRASPEADLQKVIVRDLKLVLRAPYVLHHSYNEGGKRSKAVQGILKAMGVHAGFSDLLLIGPERRVLFLEVKPPKGGHQHASQVAFEADVTSFGWPYAIVRSSQDAIAAAENAGFPMLRVRHLW